MNEQNIVCPKCGTVCGPKSNSEPGAEPLQTTHAGTAQGEQREYDRRGVLLPRRTRVGGIITPQ